MLSATILKCSVSCTGNQHLIPGDRAPAVTMIGWHGTALGCRRWGPAFACCKIPCLQLSGNSKWRWRLSDL